MDLKQANEELEEKNLENGRSEDSFQHIKWLLTKSIGLESSCRDKKWQPQYGDLVELNSCRLVADALGKDILADIAGDCLDLLDSSSAIYEKNGDYALGIFSSGWCRFLDQASRDLCNTHDNSEALMSGKWLCHESCWTIASKVSIETGKPVDVDCHGGIRLYAVPIRAGDEIVGSINFGYGDPPRDPQRLGEIAGRYCVSVRELQKYADAYESRPHFIIGIAKKRLLTSAKLIGKIVERRQAEKALEEKEILERKISENRLLTIVQNMPVMLFAFDKDRKFVAWNKECECVTGYMAHEIIGNPEALQLLSTDRGHRNKILAEIESLDFDFRDYECELYCKDGTKKTLSISKSSRHIPIPGWETWAIGIDISSRKRMEETLREREEFLNIVINTTPNCIFVKDRNGKYLLANQAQADLFGMTAPETMTGKTDLDFARMMRIRDEEARAFTSDDQEVFETRRPKFIPEEPLTPPDGLTRWFQTIKVPFPLSDGAQAVLGVATDITEHKQIKEALKNAELERTTLLDHQSDLVALQTLDNRIIWANKTACESVCMRREDMTGRKCYEIWAQRNESCPDCPVNKAIDTGQPQSIEKTTPDGRTWHIRGCPVRNEQGEITHALEVTRDITEAKAIEAKLRQAQKMEAVGTLSGGIAHDFNNILAIILGFAEMAADDLPDRNPARDSVKEIIKAAHRAKDMVKQILAFSSPSDMEKRHMKIQTIVKEALKFLRSAFPATVDIHADISPECGTIMGDPTQIHQLLMNLGANAVHAMQETGVLTISLKEENLIEADLLNRPGMKPGPYAKLSVRDTGEGIDQAIQDRIFDPFFTTKEVGKGTGLGLSVVYGIVEGHGGMIKVDSETGEGTAFHIFLPVSGEEPAPAVQSDEPLRTGSERILFVDDEESIVKMGKGILEHLGYKVTASASSKEALEIFRSSPMDFDLVITDQTMPHMTGLELSRQLLEIRPGIPIILCTGYSAMISEKMARDAGIREFAMKPIERLELVKAVARALDVPER